MSEPRMRPCPIFRVDVTQERSAEFFVAAETIDEARTQARTLAGDQMDGWGCFADYDIAVRLDPEPHPRAVHEYGIWVQSYNGGKGDWVQYVDDVPDVVAPPDPNQLALPLDIGGELDLTPTHGIHRIQTIATGGIL